MASIASSAFISSEISLKTSWRISCGSAKNSTPSSALRRLRIRWERWTTLSLESFICRGPCPRVSQDDPLFLGQLLLHHLEHLGVGDVGALHLRRVLHQDLPHFLVQAVLALQFFGDHASDALR